MPPDRPAIPIRGSSLVWTTVRSILWIPSSPTMGIWMRTGMHYRDTSTTSTSVPTLRTRRKTAASCHRLSNNRLRTRQSAQGTSLGGCRDILVECIHEVVTSFRLRFSGRDKGAARYLIPRGHANRSPPDDRERTVLIVKGPPIAGLYASVPNSRDSLTK